ncbi:MAG: hypothetical protein NVS4B2_05220 [Chloroflexota bacterium]
MKHRPTHAARTYVGMLAFFLVMMAGADTVSAHALLLRSSPAADTVLERSPAFIQLWFSEDLNGSASKIVVWDRYRHEFNRTHAALVPGQSRRLQVGLRPMHPGAYLVLWTSVSAQDGHILHGSYLFFVQQRGPGPSLAGVSTGGNAQSFPGALDVANIVSHWVELLAVTLWAGSAAFSWLIVGRMTSIAEQVRAHEEMRARSVLRLALVVLVLAGCATLALQAYSLAGSWSSASGVSTWREIFDVQYGKLWIARQLLALVALMAVIYGAGARRSATAWRITGLHANERGSLTLQTHAGGSARALLVLAGIVYLYLLAASGHASSADVGAVWSSHIVSVSVGIDWLHLLGASLWFGGQMYILFILIPSMRNVPYSRDNVRAFLQTLNRFSVVAYASVALFTLSGPINGKIHIDSWYALFNSVYGRTLMVKVILTALMMLTSAVTVYALRPRIQRLAATPAGSGHDPAARALHNLYRWLRIEPGLGLGVLLATSVMFYYPVPPGFAPTGPGSYTMRASGITATLILQPDRSGPNAATVQLHDARGRPLLAHVTVLSTMLDMVMGTGLASLQQSTPGTYRGTVDLGMGGHWRLELLIYQPSGTLVRMSARIQVGT